MSEAGVAAGVAAIVFAAVAVHQIYASNYLFAAGFFIVAAVGAVIAAALEG